MEFPAAGLLAVLAAAVFAAQSAGRRMALTMLGASFAVTVFAFSRLPPLGTTTLGFGVAAAAIAALARPRWWLLAPLAAGVCASAWVSILGSQGLPWLPGTLAASGLLAAASISAARRRGFMPDEMRDEALLIVASFALLLSLGPGVVDGWRSSVALKAEPLAAESPQAGPWLGALVAASMLLGGAYSLWKRK